MSSRSEVLAAIEDGKVIAILRGAFHDRHAEIGAVLCDAGIKAIEVTLNSPDALSAISKLARCPGIVVGAGTVLNPQGVIRAADSGARFIVSPDRNRLVIEQTIKLGAVSIPGAFTPSEINEAVDAGADLVKLFPAMCLGPAFVRAVRAPLGDSVALVPTGGVTPILAGEYIASGARAVGVGSELVGADVLQTGGIDRLAAKASEFVIAVNGNGTVSSK
jgi:Entner-Doudoroff aldolase